MWAHPAKGRIGVITRLLTTLTSPQPKKKSKKNNQKALQEGLGRAEWAVHTNTQVQVHTQAHLHACERGTHVNTWCTHVYTHVYMYTHIHMCRKIQSENNMENSTKNYVVERAKMTPHSSSGWLCNHRPIVKLFYMIHYLMRQKLQIPPFLSTDLTWLWGVKFTTGWRCHTNVL